MLKRLIDNVFKKRPRKAHVLELASHGITRDKLSRGALSTCEGLARAGYKAYVVGGAVRDLALKRDPKDFDVATDATPEQVHAVFRRSRIIGKRFRIVHVLFGPETVEVSTFRTDDLSAAPTDEHGRVLRDNTFGSIATDATRRDFTVNALYYDPATQTVIDYHGGMKDLAAKKMRMIGDPETRYREDPVRMLRVARFAGKLGFTIDAKTRAPISELSNLLENVPSSRLFDEILKLLLSGHAVACVRALRDEQLHRGVLPLLDVILSDPQGEKFVMLALKRTDERLAMGKGVSPGFLFAALLWHEVQKTWDKVKARGEHALPALFEAMNEVLDVQCEKLAIQRRFIADMREIWVMQPRFERSVEVGGRQAFKLLEHPRFRAAYDFVLLRGESGEIEKSIGEWWTNFIDADPEARNQMTTPKRETSGEGGKRRRRRRKPAEDAAERTAREMDETGDEAEGPTQDDGREARP
jgi:poly(A) polymerase